MQEEKGQKRKDMQSDASRKRKDMQSDASRRLPVPPRPACQQQQMWRWRFALDAATVFSVHWWGLPKEVLR